MSNETASDAQYTSKNLETALKWYLQTTRAKLTPAQKAKLTSRIKFYTRVAKEKPAVIAGYLALFDLEDLASDAGSEGKSIGSKARPKSKNRP